MYTIVIPTMWKYGPFPSFLKELCNHYLVGEIIIIDNDRLSRPDNLPNSYKLSIYDPGENIYVNPAWNYGALKARFDKICFLNDDVIFDLRVFAEVIDYITPELGIMGPSIVPWNTHITDGLIRIKDYEQGDSQWGIFVCLFMHREVYMMLSIPDSLKVYFGDNYLFDCCLFTGKPIKLIKDLWMSTPTSVTTSSLGDKLDQIKINDSIAYRNFLVSMGIQDPYVWSPAIKQFLEYHAPELL